MLECVGTRNPLPCLRLRAGAAFRVPPVGRDPGFADDHWGLSLDPVMGMVRRSPHHIHGRSSPKRTLPAPIPEIGRPHPAPRAIPRVTSRRSPSPPSPALPTDNLKSLTALGRQS